MNMEWLLILFIWLIAPFAELGIIIWLAVENNRYKDRIRELTLNRRQPAPAGQWPDPDAGKRTETLTTAEAAGSYTKESDETETLTAAEASESGAEESSEAETLTAVEASESSAEESSEAETLTAAEASELSAEESSETETLTTAADPEPNRQGGWTAMDEPHPEKAVPYRPAPRFREPPLYKPRPALKAEKNIGNGLGTAALIIGVIFVVLAGLIFATTTWRVLPDVSRAFLVMACAGLFFGASFLADRQFHIHKTGNAFYILGSTFLFLSVLAAAYFRLLGPEFILVGRNRWKVLWVGSLVMEASFFAGIRRFNDRIYTHATLWGLSVSLFFMSQALNIRWDGFVSIMMIYAVVLVAVREYLEGQTGHEDGREEKGVRELLAEGFRSFVPVHFWFFGIITMIRGFSAVGRMAAEGSMGVYSRFLDRFFLFRFTWFGLAALAALVFGIFVLNRQNREDSYAGLLKAAAAETIFYGASCLTGAFVYRMLAINLALLLICMIRVIRRKESSLFWDVCGCAALLVTVMGFYGSGEGRAEGLFWCLMAFAGYYVYFYLGNRQWPHLFAAVSMLPMPFIARSHLDLTFDQLGWGVAAVLVASGALARYVHPIVEKDERVQGGWRVDWFQVLSIFVILLMAAGGDDRWWFAYVLLGAVSVLQYTEAEPLKKTAFSVSACLLATVFWGQPFVTWPPVISLELGLLPAAWLIWTAGKIWGKNPWLRVMQNLGYGICLFLLCRDVFLLGQVADALIMEALCLAIFLWAQVKKDVPWARVSGALILLIVVFLTRSFWLSISWWVYLLAAGILLILFAATVEKKRR